MNGLRHTGGGGRQQWPTPARRNLVYSRGLALETCEWGDPATAGTLIVAAHGFLDCAEVFAPLAAELMVRDANVAVAAMNFAGHGGSDRADGYGWFDQVVDVAAVLNRYRSMGTRRVAMGHSFGGVQMAEALLLQPSGFELFVNLDAVADLGIVDDESAAAALAHAASRQDRTLPIYPSLQELVTRRQTYNPRLDPITLHQFALALSRPEVGGRTWKVDPALVGWVRPWDLTLEPTPDPLALMKPLALPALVITGAADDHPKIREPYPGDTAIDQIPGVEHRVIADAGHYVHLERPDAVADAVVAALARSTKARHG